MLLYMNIYFDRKAFHSSINVISPLRQIWHPNGIENFFATRDYKYTSYSHLNSILICALYTNLRYNVQCNVYIKIEFKREYEAYSLE